MLAGNPAAQQAILDSALQQVPVIGPQLQEPRGLGGGPVGLLEPESAALYGGLEWRWRCSTR